MRVVIVGDSHVHAIERALKKKPVPGWSAHRFRREKARGSIEGIGLDDLPELFAGCDLVITALGGSIHATTALTLGKNPFDFGENAEPPLVPYRAMAMAFDRELLPVRQTLEAVKSGAACPVVQLICPPPKADEGFLRKHLKQFARFEASLDPGYRPIRLKLWKLEAERMTALCAALGIETLPAPAQTFADDGFLASRFYADDIAHANAAYGGQVITQIEHYAATALMTAKLKTSASESEPAERFSTQTLNDPAATFVIQ